MHQTRSNVHALIYVCLYRQVCIYDINHSKDDASNINKQHVLEIINVYFK